MRALLVLVLIVGVAHAEPLEQTNAPRRWHLGIEGMTDFPLSVGVQVWAELPYRIRLTVSSGEMPDGYLQTINKIATSAGAYNDRQADLITEVLDHAATFRLQVGWRPFPHRGGYIEAGFGILALQKSLTVADAIQLASGLMAPQETGIGLGYEADTVVEMVGGELGWMWYPWRDLTIRVSVAFAAAVAAQVSLSPNFASTLQKPFTRAAERYIQELLEEHLLVPTIGFAVGWRLF